MNFSSSIIKAHTVRLPYGKDLIEELGNFLSSHSIHFGTVSIIGALGRATLGSYSFNERAYSKFDIDHEVEILHCSGNITRLEDGIFAHIHAVVSGHDGKAIGGHVFEGCEIRVAECTILEFDGEPPVRELDDTTGLKLWPEREPNL